MRKGTTHLKMLDDQLDEMTELLMRWSNINSGSHNPTGLDAMLDSLKAEFGKLGGEMSILDLQDTGRSNAGSVGRALRVVKRPQSARRIFLCCHMDTVFAPAHPFQTCFLKDADTLIGPGVADAKGGILVMLKALEAFEASDCADGLGWEVLINPDEEIGSPASGHLFSEAAANNHLGLVFEPSFLDGNIVAARKGSGSFQADFRGKSAHAGRDPQSGASAINALAVFIIKLNSMAGEEGITINVGSVEGGGPVNVVPDQASCRFNVRISTSDDRAIFERRLKQLMDEIGSQRDIKVNISGKFTRPPKPLDANTEKLVHIMVACAQELELPVGWTMSGASSDGNNLAAAGLVNIDGLGPRGAGLHSSDEFIKLDSLVERSKLSALFLMKMAAGEFPT